MRVWSTLAKAAAQRKSAEVIMSGGRGKLHRKLKVNGGVWGISSPSVHKNGTGRFKIRVKFFGFFTSMTNYSAIGSWRQWNVWIIKRDQKPKIILHLCLLGGRNRFVSDSIQSLQCSPQTLMWKYITSPKQNIEIYKLFTKTKIKEL